MDKKENVNIWKALQRIPAGTMFVPLIIGAVITTITQGFFHYNLWAVLGSPMEDLFSSSGEMLLIGLMLFCTGTQLKPSDMKDALRRGMLLILVRLGVAYLLCAVYYWAFGYDGIFGISFLAFTCAVTSANAALYMGIIAPFGDKADKASFGPMLICSMPLLPLLFLGFYGESGFGKTQVLQIISLIIPFLFGCILGNLDEEIRRVFAGGNAIILPFLGFEFGSTINLVNALIMVPQGLALSVMFLVISILPSYLFERLVLHRPGYASVASGSTAGVSLAIPSVAAAANAAFTPYISDAIAELAFVLAVTNILCPFLVKYSLNFQEHDGQMPPLNQ